MADKDTIKADLGVYIRDKIRADETILGFSSEEPKNWIFFTRPKNPSQTFPVPRIIVDAIDRQDDFYGIDEENTDDILIPFTIKAWVDEGEETALTIIEIEDRVNVIAKSLNSDPDNEGIYRARVISSNTVPEESNINNENRILLRATVTVLIEWRQEGND